MGFRFRRSLRIAPGIRLNVGKRGITSTSLGGKGFTANLNRRGIRTTIGIPGTGVSYSSSDLEAQDELNAYHYQSTHSGGFLGFLEQFLNTAQLIISVGSFLFSLLVAIVICFLAFIVLFTF